MIFSCKCKKKQMNFTKLKESDLGDGWDCGDDCKVPQKASPEKPEPAVSRLTLDVPGQQIPPPQAEPLQSAPAAPAAEPMAPASSTEAPAKKSRGRPPGTKKTEKAPK